MAQAVIGALRVNLGIDSAAFDKGLGDAQGKLQSFGQRASKGLNAAGDAAIGAGKKLSLISAPLIAAGAGAVAFATNFAKAGNEIAKTATEAGMGGRAFQELSFAIGQVSQASEGEVRRGLGQLNQRIAEASEGSERAQDALLKLGFSMDEITSGAITSEQAFEAMSRNMGELGSSGEAASLAAALLGDRIGRSLGPALYEGGAAVDDLRQQFRDLGLGMSDEALGASVKLVDQMDVLNKQFSAVGAELASVLIPILSDVLVPAIQNHVIPAIRTVAHGVGQMVEWFRDLPGPVQEAAGIIAGALGAGGPMLIAVGAALKVLGALVLLLTGPVGLVAALVAVGVAAWTFREEILGAVADAVQVLIETFAGFKERVLGIWETLVEGIMGIWTGFTDRISEAVSSVTGFIGDAWQGLSDRLWGNSIIPDMVDGILAEFGRLHDGSAALNGAAVGDAVKAWGDGAQQIGSDMAGMVSNVMGSLGQMFRGSKAFSIAQALINTYTGITSALAGPFPANLAAAAAVAAQGFAQVASIRSTNPGSGGGGGAAAARSAGGGVASRQPAQQQVDQRILISGGIEPGSLWTGSMVRELMDKMVGMQDDGFKLVVVD